MVQCTRAIIDEFGTMEDFDEFLQKAHEKGIRIVMDRRREELISRGAYHRLSNPFKDAYAAWMFVSENKERAFLSVVMLEMHGNMTVKYVKLRGLEPQAVYRDAESGRRYYGADLMEAGLPMPVEQKEYPAYQIELVKDFSK